MLVNWSRFHPLVNNFRFNKAKYQIEVKDFFRNKQKKSRKGLIVMKDFFSFTKEQNHKKGLMINVACMHGYSLGLQIMSVNTYPLNEYSKRITHCCMCN